MNMVYISADRIVNRYALACTLEIFSMYPMSNDQQITFEDFNQAFGMNFSRNNEWYLLAKKIDWESIEKTYSQNFPSRRGHPAFSARIALGSLIIQKRTGFSDRALVKAIAENPYYQFFIGLTKFTNQCPFTATSLVVFRKRLGHEVIMQCNEKFLETAAPTPEHGKKRSKKPETPEENIGTMILDATCSPSNIRYPQDFSLLNEAREKTEKIIDRLHHEIDGGKKHPRTYRRILHKDTLPWQNQRKSQRRKLDP